MLNILFHSELGSWCSKKIETLSQLIIWNVKYTLSFEDCLNFMSCVMIEWVIWFCIFLSWKGTIHICANCSMPGFFNLVEFFGICMNFNLKNKEDASHRMELPTFPHQYSEILPGCTLSSSENLILPSILTRNLIYKECGNFHSL